MDKQTSAGTKAGAVAGENRIDLERFYAHPIDVVWKAISDGKAISRWFIQADFEPEVGYAYTFTHEQTTVTGEVLAVRPPTYLSYTWIVGGTTARTVVNWHLTEVEGGTLLRIEHFGFENYAAESAPGMITSSTSGWNAVAAELEKYLSGENDGG